MSVIVRIYTPADWSGYLIAWRLESQYCHATIEIDGTVYSATVPDIVALSPNNRDVAQPPRGGLTLKIDLTDDQKASAKSYCESMVGTRYDLLSVLGWAFRIPSLQVDRRVYCFELVYDALSAAGVFPYSKRLVTGEQLIIDLQSAGLLEPHAIPPSMAHVSPLQHPALIVDKK